MNQQEASRVVAFLSTARPTNDTMKGHIVNSINALLMSPDPVSVRFSQTFVEAVNNMAGTVLNEASNPVPPQARMPFGIQPPAQPQRPQQQPRQTAPESTESLLEQINNRAALLM